MRKPIILRDEGRGQDSSDTFDKLVARFLRSDDPCVAAFVRDALLNNYFINKINQNTRGAGALDQSNNRMKTPGERGVWKENKLADFSKIQARISSLPPDQASQAALACEAVIDAIEAGKNLSISTSIAEVTEHPLSAKGLTHGTTIQHDRSLAEEADIKTGADGVPVKAPLLWKDRGEANWLMSPTVFIEDIYAPFKDALTFQKLEKLDLTLARRYRAWVGSNNPALSYLPLPRQARSLARKRAKQYTP